MTEPKADALVGGQATHGPSFVGEYDCVELYLPKRLAYLSALYAYLHKRLRERPDEQARALAFGGFSIYEVDGAWADPTAEQSASASPTDEPSIDERTLVIRVLAPHNEEHDSESFKRKLNELAKDIAELAPGEKEILISYHRQHAFTYSLDRHK
jgi:hypothetical protein